MTATMSQTPESISPQLLLGAYCQGYFAMADGPDGELGWYRPDPRCVQPFLDDDPLGGFRVRRSLAKRCRNAGYLTTTNLRFDEVIRACALPRSDDNGVWLSEQLIELYQQLHRAGFAHSIETWHGDQLIGGLYGVAIGAAFFGESMFSRRPDASQVAYVSLINRLRRGGFQLLDVQFSNPHLEQFGVIEIPGDDYLALLGDALTRETNWHK